MQATKAAGHLRELVAFARRDGVSQKVELKAAVERAVSLRRYYLTRGRVVVNIEAPADESLVVRADSQHVIQVLVNLVINAEESVAKLDVRTIRIRVWRHDGAAHIEFGDSGPGFDAGDRGAGGGAVPRRTSRRRSRAGTGVAKRLVEADGGTLTISPMPAVVTVSWPDAV